MVFGRTSALTGDGINESINDLIKIVLEKTEVKKQTIVIDDKVTQSSQDSGGCCKKKK
jgi:hypothetical protein